MNKKTCSLLLAAALTFAVFAGCSDGSGNASAPSATTSGGEAASSEATPLSALDFDNTAWNYNAEDDVYWQIGVVYCENPVDTAYESMGIYVPAAYLTATENGDGTYTCQVNPEGRVGNYTAATAPMVMPVNTPGYAAMSAPTEYTTGLNAYLEEGFLYVFAGCRGRMNTGMGGGGGFGRAGGPDAQAEAGTPSAEPREAPQADTSAITETDDADTASGASPWAVADLKAAIRYLRYNANVLPGDTDKVITFGMSGGGAQSALVGATGDSALYTPYLESIGAAVTDASGNPISDVVFGTMAWCPITSLDYANEAYEWNMGQYSNANTRAEGTFTGALSDDMAEAYAAYINALGLTSEDGTVLVLETSENGIYTSGSYYDYLLSVVEQSLNNFLGDTSFPYTPNNRSQAGFAGNAGGNDGATRENTSTVSYATIEEYVDFLNADEEWIAYDPTTNTATVSSMAAFIRACKNPSKAVGAFDSPSRSAGENDVFGTDENESLHFDPIMAALLQENQEVYAAYSDWDAAYPDAFAEDLSYVDALGTGIAERQNMYNPMYYLSSYYDGYGSSTVAPHWRIRTGINQGDTALTVETNLALALEQYAVVEDVDFATVWGQQHTTAERTSDATTNFIAWVKEVCA